MIIKILGHKFRLAGDVDIELVKNKIADMYKDIDITDDEYEKCTVKMKIQLNFI